MAADGTPEQHFRQFLNDTALFMPIIGSGSPEGFVEARQYATYIDETDPLSPTLYIKMVPAISDDRKKGWVDARTISDLTAENITTTDITAGDVVTTDLTAKNVYRTVGSGEGDKFGTETSSDWGWSDVTGDISVRGVAATDPTWTQISTGPLYAFAFDVADYVWIQYLMPHNIVPGSEMYFQAHWLASGTDTNTVKWQFDYAYSDGYSRGAFDPTGVTLTAEEAPTGTAYTHMTTESGLIAVTAEPSGILYARVGRVANGATDNTDTIFLLEADVKYQSTGIPATKNRSPDFYT